MKEKRSYRLTEEAIRKISDTAKNLGLTQTGAVEVLVRQAPNYSRSEEKTTYQNHDRPKTTEKQQ